MKYQIISLKQSFLAKGAIYYVAIATVIFSHVKMTRYFHVWRYHVFARTFTWHFIGVYIINRVVQYKGQQQRNTFTPCQVFANICPVKGIPYTLRCSVIFPYLVSNWRVCLKYWQMLFNYNVNDRLGRSLFSFIK